MIVALSDADSTTGHESNYCGGKKRQGEGTCRLPAGHGTDHVGIGRCRRHGGNTPTHVAAATTHILEARIREMFGKTYDDTPVTNPLEVFAELAGEVRGWLSVMRQMVADLTSPGYRSEMSGEQIRAEVQLYERAMDRANTVLATYARLNIDSRLAAITEAQGRIVLAAIQAALASAGVSGARAIEAGRVAAAKMRVLEAEAGKVEDA